MNKEKLLKFDITAYEISYNSLCMIEVLIPTFDTSFLTTKQALWKLNLNSELD